MMITCLNAKKLYNAGKQGSGILINKFANVYVINLLIVNNNAEIGGGFCIKDAAELKCVNTTILIIVQQAATKYIFMEQ